MDEPKEDKQPEDTAAKDAEWQSAAKEAGEQVGTQAANAENVDAKDVAEKGRKAGSDAAWQKGGDEVSQAGGEIGKDSAIQSWGDQLKSNSNRDIDTMEQKVSDQKRIQYGEEKESW